MDSVQTQTFSIKGDGGGEAYIDFCDGQLYISVVVEGKQADFRDRNSNCVNSKQA